MPEVSNYRPVDTLYLWWTGDPTQPVLIGELGTVRTLTGVSLRYDAGWLRAGFPLSEDLPLIEGEFLPRGKDMAAGAVDDARPDRWGERVIRVLDKPLRLSLMEFLYFAGDERFGALGVSVSPAQYLPRRLGPLPELADVAQIDELIKKVLAGEPVPAEQRRLIAPGATMGGARPKALLNIDAEQWVLKFAEPGDHIDTPLIEHAAMTLARRAEINVAATQAIALAQGHAVAVKRFDRMRVGYDVGKNVAVSSATRTDANTATHNATSARQRHALSANVASASSATKPKPRCARWSPSCRVGKNTSRRRARDRPTSSPWHSRSTDHF